MVLRNGSVYAPMHGWHFIPHTYLIIHGSLWVETFLTFSICICSVWYWYSIYCTAGSHPYFLEVLLRRDWISKWQQLHHGNEEECIRKSDEHSKGQNGRHRRTPKTIPPIKTEEGRCLCLSVLSYIYVQYKSVSVVSWMPFSDCNAAHYLFCDRKWVGWQCVVGNKMTAASWRFRSVCEEDLCKLLNN